MCNRCVVYIGVTCSICSPYIQWGHFLAIPGPAAGCIVVTSSTLAGVSLCMCTQPSVHSGTVCYLYVAVCAHEECLCVHKEGLLKAVCAHKEGLLLAVCP